MQVVHSILFYVGYAFLLFRDEIAVQRLVDHCVSEDGKLFTFVSSVTQTNKKVCSPYTTMYTHRLCITLKNYLFCRFKFDHGFSLTVTLSWTTLSPLIHARPSSLEVYLDH